MKSYRAYLVIGEERVEVEFMTDISPVEFLWQRYGMSTYIESLVEITTEED